MLLGKGLFQWNSKSSCLFSFARRAIPRLAFLPAVPHLQEGGSAGLGDSFLSARKSEYLQQSRWWDQFILLQNMLVEAGHSVQGTHAGVNACLRLQRAWSDSSAEGDPRRLSQSPVMIQAPASLGILLLSQLKKTGAGIEYQSWQQGSIKIVYLAAASWEGGCCCTTAVEWQQKVPAGWCRCAGGSASCLTDWLGKSQWEGVLLLWCCLCQCKTVCIALLDVLDCVAFMVNDVSLS